MLTVISEAAKHELLGYLRCAPERVRVVHCPLPTGFVPVPKEFNEACPVILQVGAKQNKNICRVAEALEGIPCHLRIIGQLSSEQIARLHTHAVEYSSVAGITSEQVMQEYSDCDMVVFASTYEGFGLPIVEAQAVGRPVITSNILSMPEVAGDAACLVDPFDATSIRTGIQRIVQDRAYREALVDKGYRNADRFHPATVAAQYLSVYREVLGRA